MFLTRVVSTLLSILDPRSDRLRLRVFLANRCPDPSLLSFNLPVAVTLKRLAADLFVFLFGIRDRPYYLLSGAQSAVLPLGKHEKL